MGSVARWVMAERPRTPRLLWRSVRAERMSLTRAEGSRSPLAVDANRAQAEAAGP